MKLMSVLISILSLLFIQSCTGVIFITGYVGTSPKLLVYAANKSYDKKIDVSIMIDDKPYEINATIKCIKEGVYFGGLSSGSWEEKWKITLVNNEVISHGEKYKLAIGDIDPRRKVYYEYKVRRGWCNAFLVDDKVVEKVNNDNSIVLVPDDNGTFKNTYDTNPYGRLSNRSFLYFTHEEKNRETKWGSDYKYIAKNLVIRSFKIYD